MTSSATGDPRIGIALGGGSARGLAHIPFIEAMDEMGLRPASIAGTSIGALIGSGWAAGLEGRVIRELAYDMLGSMNSLFGRLLSTHMRSIKQVLAEGLSIQLDAERVVDAFTPIDMPERFSALKIPFACVATDFRSWHQVVYTSGLLKPAIAGSLAIPSLFKPVHFQKRLLVDGGVVNPLPLDCAGDDPDILIGIDVNGDPHDWPSDFVPSALDIGLGSAQIMMHQLTAHMIAAYPPDLYFRPHLRAYGAYEYWRVREIIAASDADKDRFKRELAAKLEAFIGDRQRTP
ncbi:patatin-like phospholipase family protein [Pelagibacterium montanilacus]|uniref:patatin-like phospholipase family protein n=1 Tax=Pelagibacterium montanilacus TaxID=2185280 RepID=UPI000F8DCF8C|nr:patatin-like phospholipase family protein [Pelagibacterium montanilacus]